MVVFQNTVTHPFPARNIFGGLNIIRIIGYLANKNDPCLFVQGVIGNPISPDLIAMPLQLPDIFLIQSSSGFVPEFNGSLELLDIIIAQPWRQRI